MKKCQSFMLLVFQTGKKPIFNVQWNDSIPNETFKEWNNKTSEKH